MVRARLNGINLEMIIGDITEQKVQAVVNAANPSLLGGKGVDGAIHKKGGPEILEECKLIRKKSGKLPTGQAVITTAGKLPAERVIHTVGPVWRSGSNQEKLLLRSAYHESLLLAQKHDIKSIAFPSISTGAYGFPTPIAAKIFIFTITKYCNDNHQLPNLIRMVLFSKQTFKIFLSDWENIIINRKQLLWEEILHGS